MERVSLPEELRPGVLAHIKSRLHDDISTAEVYSHIKEFLVEKDEKASLRFNLKQAIFELGPTGFPFERYMGRIFETMGYKTAVDVNMRGECVMHEIDLLLERDGRREVVEAKFHNQVGIKTDIHVAMYTYARFLDVAEPNKIENVWIVTNTKLSEDAAIYLQCKKMNAIAWNYPEKGNLQDFVEQPSMYPITILPNLSGEDKQQLLTQADILLCSELVNASEEKLAGLMINKDKLKKAQEHAKMIYSPPSSTE